MEVLGLKAANQHYVLALMEFYKYFGRLITITQHEDCIIRARYGAKPLLIMAKQYIKNNRPIKETELGLNIADAYLQELIRGGVCHYTK